jgi:hypothetical protein
MTFVSLYQIKGVDSESEALLQGRQNLPITATPAKLGV